MATKTAKKATKKATAQAANTTKFLRKSFRAYVGLYGAAYERIQPVFKTAGKNFDTFAAKGEAIETLATKAAQDVRVRANKTFDTAKGKVRSALPRSANDRVQELETEIAKLNKKIVTLTKKAPKKIVKRVTKTAAQGKDATKAA